MFRKFGHIQSQPWFPLGASLQPPKSGEIETSSRMYFLNVPGSGPLSRNESRHDGTWPKLTWSPATCTTLRVWWGAATASGLAPQLVKDFLASSSTYWWLGSSSSRGGDQLLWFHCDRAFRSPAALLRRDTASEISTCLFGDSSEQLVSSLKRWTFVAWITGDFRQWNINELSS
jgi:hypothetical protein